jgi:putative membrane protein
MRTHIAALLVSAALAAGTGTASAKEILGFGTPDATQFRAKATSSDAFEILSSRIALTHATTADIKDFAQMMIDDHTKSTNELVALGGISKASLKAKMKAGPDGKFAANNLLDSDRANELNSLGSKSNDDFNKTYVKDQVDGHKQMVSLLDDYAKNGDNAKLKDFARKILPTVRLHLKKAQEIQRTIGA